jgi:hypothetical protein
VNNDGDGVVGRCRKRAEETVVRRIIRTPSWSEWSSRHLDT